MPGFFSAHPYPYKHWLSSVCLAPLLSILESMVIHHQRLAASIELYIVFIAFGLVLSLPAFLLYHLLFNLLVKKISSPLFLKLLLNLFAVCAALVSFTLLDGSEAQHLAIIYAAAVVLNSFFFKIKQVGAVETTESLDQ